MEKRFDFIKTGTYFDWVEEDCLMGGEKIRLAGLISYVKWSFFFSDRSIFLSRLGTERPPRAPRVDVDFRFVSLAEILSLPNDDFDYDDESKRYADERIKDGDDVVIGYVGDEPVFYCWMMYGKIDLHYRCYRPLDQKSVYSYKSYTKESYRGNGIFNDYYLFIQEHWEQRGYKHVYNFVDVNNIPSLKINEKVGFFKIGKLITFGALGSTLSFVSLDSIDSAPKGVVAEFREIGRLAVGRENPL